MKQHFTLYILAAFAVLFSALAGCAVPDDPALTIADYPAVTGTVIEAEIGQLTVTSGIIVDHPFVSGTVIYGVSSDGNYFKLRILNDMSEVTLANDTLDVAYVLYDKNSPDTVIQSSELTEIGSTFTLDLETNTPNDSTDDLWFYNHDNFEFDLEIDATGMRCLAILP